MKLLLAALVLFQSSAFAIEKMPSETGDYCLDQAIGHMRFELGRDVALKKVFSESYPEGTNYWMKSSACKGYIIAELQKNATCTAANYGLVPVYVKRLWAKGDCTEVLRHDAYPTRETTFPFIKVKQ